MSNTESEGQRQTRISNVSTILALICIIAIVLGVLTLGSWDDGEVCEPNSVTVDVALEDATTGAIILSHSLLSANDSNVTVNLPLEPSRTGGDPRGELSVTIRTARNADEAHVSARRSIVSTEDVVLNGVPKAMPRVTLHQGDPHRFILLRQGDQQSHTWMMGAERLRVGATHRPGHCSAPNS